MARLLPHLSGTLACLQDPDLLFAAASDAAGDAAGGYTTAAYTAMRPGGFRSLLRSAYSAEVFEFR
jgi:hypothetical protein